jgi:hypothetical protein
MKGRNVPPAVERGPCEHKLWSRNLSPEGNEEYWCSRCPVLIILEDHSDGWLQMHVCLPRGSERLSQAECQRAADALQVYLAGEPCHHTRPVLAA